MQAVGLIITNQCVILLSLTLSVLASLFHTAITYEAEQIYYNQNYSVVDTNEWGLGNCSKLITALPLKAP